MGKFILKYKYEDETEFNYYEGSSEESLDSKVSEFCDLSEKDIYYEIYQVLSKSYITYKEE